MCQCSELTARQILPTFPGFPQRCRGTDEAADVRSLFRLEGRSERQAGRFGLELHSWTPAEPARDLHLRPRVESGNLAQQAAES